MSTALVRRLERWKVRYGGDAGRRKHELLRRLETARLRSAGAVLRLHEALCFLRAYPDDAALLARVERLLHGFERRADLRRHDGALKDSGIAGTEIHYPFFAEMAHWLADFDFFGRHKPSSKHFNADRAAESERTACRQAPQHDHN